MLSQHVCLEHDEIDRVVCDLKRRCKRSINARLNRIIFRLSCCEGMRATEISKLRICDVMVSGPHPTITVHRKTTKTDAGKRAIPLNWSPATLADIAEWHAYRLQTAPNEHAPFVCSVSSRSFGRPLTRFQVNKKWRNAIRVLGPERVKQSSVHKGRHTFISHAAVAGYSFPEVASVVGHADPSITARTYTHIVKRLSGETLPAVFRS